MAPGHGRADYLLFVDQRPVGVIEAQPVGAEFEAVAAALEASAAGGEPA